MKNFLIAILAFVYFGASTGVTLHIHHCMGKLSSWSIGNDKSNFCNKCGMAKSDINTGGCCNDENTIFQIATDQKITESAFKQILPLTPVVPAHFLQIRDAAYTMILEENPVSNAPPQNSSIAVYLRNCVFRI